MRARTQRDALKSINYLKNYGATSTTLRRAIGVQRLSSSDFASAELKALSSFYGSLTLSAASKRTSTAVSRCIPKQEKN